MSIESLVQQIKAARIEYWDNEDPSISDSNYDQLLIELEILDPTNPILLEVESKVIDESLKVKHPIRLLSLDKVYSLDEVFSWMRKVARSESERFVIMPKYDGLACRFYKDTNTLATRGEGGIEGENITSKIPLITNIDFNKLTSNLSGELLCTTSNFEKTTARRSNGEPYVTERNLAAGVVNNKSIESFIGKVELTLVAYDEHKYVRGMDEVDGNVLNTIIEELLKLGYPTDGVVIALEDSVYAESLGVTSHHPKHSIALKFPDEEKEALMIDAIFQTGKGKITPVAIIEPTLLDGVIVRRLSMHNVKFCLDNDIRIGDKLVIKRAGRVTPNIVRSIPGETRTQLSIDACPSCGGDIEYKEPFLYCASKDCSGSIKKKLQYAAGVIGLDVLGPGAIDKCVNLFGCETLPDLVRLNFEDFMELDGFAETSANNARLAVDALLNKSHPDYNILSCMAIPGLGVGIWKPLLVEYDLNELCSLDEYTLSQLPNIGPERAASIYHTLNNPSSIELLTDLHNTFDVSSTKGSVSTNKTVCFSGKFPFPKKHYEQLALSKGYDTVSSVTRDLDVLVNSGAVTSKVSKAKSYGIQVVDLDGFERL